MMSSFFLVNFSVVAVGILLRVAFNLSAYFFARATRLSRLLQIVNKIFKVLVDQNF